VERGSFEEISDLEEGKDRLIGLQCGYTEGTEVTKGAENDPKIHFLSS
jgi:hypothetical protein